MTVTVNINSGANIVPSVSEGSSNFKAGFLSDKNLISALGVTGERQIGYMTVNTLSDWYAKLTANHPVGTTTDGSGSEGNWPFGATGSWKHEWWAVHNYLEYGGKVCITGTGSNSNTTSPDNTMQTTHIRFDAIFGTTSGQNNRLIDIAGARKDCVAICPIAITRDIGSNANLADLPGGSSGDQYTFYVAGSKFHLDTANRDSTKEDESTLILSTLAPDAAGCFARTYAIKSPWASPAGINRGRILSIVRLQQELTSTSAGVLYTNRVNPVQTFAGEGTYLYGDKTRSETADNDTLKHVGVVNLVNWMRKNLSDISRSTLFEVNDAATRAAFISRAQPLLRRVQAENGITEFRVVCDTTNNTTDTILENKFIADIYIKPINSIQTIELQIVTALPAQTISYDSQESVESDSSGGGVIPPGSGGSNTGIGSGLRSGGSY
tara:strand:+ start:95 stop:1408 length:1314 start_codon:yes stop_codon:yes gene_type:complete